MGNRSGSDEGSTTVGIVVVNWNTYEDSAACLRSLRDLNYPDYQVIVVDNGSTDGSGSRLAEEFEWCEFVFNETNRGFGGGCNTGIDAALSMDSDQVLLLNPDARLSPDTLSELVAVARDSGADIVGGTIVSEDGSVVNPTPCYYPDMLFYSGYRSKLPWPLHTQDKRNEERWFAVDRIEGAGVLLAGDVLRERRDKVGTYLDESLFMYCEEIELALWCRERGKLSVVATEAVIEHASTASSTRPFQLYYLTRNRVLIAHRYFSTLDRFAFDVLYVLTRFALAGRWLLNGKNAVGRAILRGLVDGYRGVGGRTR